MSQGLLSSLQNTLDCLSKAREESRVQSMDSGDFNDRFTNLERAVVQIVARLDKVEAKPRSSNNVEDALATSERLLREILVEMVKQQNIIERYRQENEQLKERLHGHGHSQGQAPAQTHVPVKPKEKEGGVTFSNTTTTITPSTRPTPTTITTYNNATKPTLTPSLQPTSTPTPTSTPILNSTHAPSYNTPHAPSHDHPFATPQVPTASKSTKRVATKSSVPTKQTVLFKGKPRAGADDEENDDEGEPESSTTTITTSGVPQGLLPVSFPPGYNRNRGRRNSVAGESLNPMSDMSNAPRNHVKKSEAARGRISSVIKTNILFKNLDEDQVESLVDEMFEVRLRPDEVVIRQGDDGDNFYIVDSGELYILYRDVVVATIGSGKSFGEIALMYNCPRTATVRAKSDCILWGMSRGTFRRSLMIYAIRKRERYESFLARVPLLEALLPYERSIIADALEPKSYRDGDILIRQGEKGDNFYILEKGKVVVTKGDSPVELKAYGEGDYFGELALLNDQPRAANVRAVGVVRVLTLSREDFSNLMGPCEEILKRNMNLYQQVQEETATTSASLSKPRDLHTLVHEFVEEENNYLRSLQILVTNFLVPLRKASENNSLPIKDEEVATVFSNLEMLSNIHNQFSPEANKLPDMTPSDIAKVFTKAFPGFKFYNEYMNNWKSASEIAEKKKADPAIEQFLKSADRAPYDFISLLRGPFERIPKIVAFLKDVYATTNDKDIADAASKLSTIGNQ